MVQMADTYIFSDALHQIKTVSNAGESKKRQLWVRKMCYLIMCVNHLLLVYKCNGKNIGWSHLEKLYQNDKGADRSAPGLAMVPKLKYEHLYLTSFSKMCIDLGAQVNFFICFISTN